MIVITMIIILIIIVIIIIIMIISFFAGADHISVHRKCPVQGGQYC